MLALQCQCLQEVDLTDCESLTNSVCQVFNDGGGCPMLKSLVLDNCEVCEYGCSFDFSEFIDVFAICNLRCLRVDVICR